MTDNQDNEYPPQEEAQKLSNFNSVEASKRSFRQSELEGNVRTDQPENNVYAQGGNFNSEALGYDGRNNSYPKSPVAENEVRIDFNMNDGPLNMEGVQPIQQERIDRFQNPSANTSYRNQQPQSSTYYDSNVQNQPVAYDNKQPQANPTSDPISPVDYEDIAPVVADPPKQQVEADLLAQKCNWHIGCLIFTCILWIFIIICIALRESSIIWAWLILGAAIFGYYNDCKKASTANYLQTNFNPKEADKELEKILKSPAGIKFRIECYHIEKRTVKVRRQDRYVDREVEEKKVTHKAHGHLVYKEVFDQTGEVDLDPNYVTRLHLVHERKFVDKRSEDLYKRQKVEFYKTNKKDTKADFSETFYLDYFVENLLIIPKGAELPLLFNYTSYIIFSVIGLSWFYRMWFDMKTSGKVLTIKKAFSVDMPN